MLPRAFWDASALVPLCVRQRNTNGARVLAERFTPVVWWASPVEISSALARLHRHSMLTAQAKEEAEVRLRALMFRWHEIQPSDAVRQDAARILNLYPLRAADSLQLAAASIWCRNVPAGRVFLTADDRLAQAAGLAGFDVLRP